MSVKFLLLCMTFIFSCSKEQKIVDGDIEPPMPNFFERSFNWHGVDSDNDGVIDEVEIWINENIQDKNLRKAFKQYASDVRIALIKAESSDVKSYTEQMINSLHCVTFFLSSIYDYRYEERALFDEFNSILHNDLNRERKQRRQLINHSFVSSRSRSVKPILLEWKYCKFKIENLTQYEQILIRKYPGSLERIKGEK